MSVQTLTKGSLDCPLERACQSPHGCVHGSLHGARHQVGEAVMEAIMVTVAIMVMLEGSVLLLVLAILIFCRLAHQTQASRRTALYATTEQEAIACHEAQTDPGNLQVLGGI